MHLRYEPLSEQHIIDTFSEMSSRYEKLMDHELGLFWGYRYQEFVEAFLQTFQIKKGQTVLDIATGTGAIPANLLARQDGDRKIVGLDLTFRMLEQAKTRLQEIEGGKDMALVCGSAEALPFRKQAFDHILCCLATHHIPIESLLSNIRRVKKENREGLASIADVGGSSKWKIGIIRLVIKILAFLYFLVFENFSRAMAESDALQNVRTAAEWVETVNKSGFAEVKVEELPSRRMWAPNPIIIQFY